MNARFPDAVLVLVREGSDPRTGKKIASEAASWKAAWSLLLKSPQAAYVLLSSHLDRMRSLDEEALWHLSDSQDKGLVEEDDEHTLSLTRDGLAYLRERAL